MSVEVTVEIDHSPPSAEAAQHGDWLAKNFFALTKEFQGWTTQTTARLESTNLTNLELPEVELDPRKKVGKTKILDTNGHTVTTYTEKEIQIAALLNFLASYKVLRKDKKPYTVHPMFVDAIVTHVCKLQPEQLLIARIYALIHDFIEEDTLRLIKKHITDPNAGCIPPDFSQSTTENLRSAKEILNTILPELRLGDAALDMMHPQVGDTVSYEYNHARFIHWLNWRAETFPYIRVVKIADKIHDLLDLDYITKNPEKTTQERANLLANKLAKIYFSMYNLVYKEDKTLHDDVPTELWQVFLYIFKQRLNELSIDSASPDGEFLKTFATYQSNYTSKKTQMMLECREYAEKVGLETT